LLRPPTDRSDEPIRVLHVDDDPAVRDLVGTYLERVDEDLRVESVECTDRALARLAEGGVDCLLSDYEMPGTDGLDFLTRVRETHGDLPFVLYTGRGDESVAAEAIARGVDDYAQKGSGRTHYLTLGTRIRRQVERARAERERDVRAAALEAAREGICILDADGRIRDANGAYAGLYGYCPGDLVGESWERLHPESEADLIVEEVLPEVAREGEWRGEGVGLRADGTTFRESKSVATLPDDGFVVVVTAYED
jgi:PAS domain S-box-containing protein